MYKPYQLGILPLPQGQLELSAPLQARDGLMALRNGGFDLDGAEVVLIPDQISLRFVEVQPVGEQLTRLVDAIVAEALKGWRLLRVYAPDDTQRQTWVKFLRLERDWRYTQTYGQPMVITFRREYPFYLASADEPAYLDDGWVLDGSWEIGQGNVTHKEFFASPSAIEIDNTGPLRIPRGYISAVPRAGSSLVNFAIVNDTNDYEFEWTGTLAAGERLEIDLLSRAVEVDGVGEYANFIVPDDQRAWMLLNAGVNDIRLLSDAVVGTTDVYWQWSRHYP